MARTSVATLPPNVKNIIGQKFSLLTVVGYVGSDANGTHWLCKCDCGCTKQVSLSNLRSGSTKACGCLRGRAIKHGLYYAAEYRVWTHLVQRCTNPKNTSYQNYGGRGIKVCERWRESFVNFFSDMGSRPTSKHQIDRIDNDGHYEPGNCRWATVAEQNRNMRRSQKITFNGRTMTIAEWGREIQLAPHALKNRLKKGWSIEAALTTPSKKARMKT